MAEAQYGEASCLKIIRVDDNCHEDRLWPDSLCIKDNNCRFAGLSEGLYLFAVKFNFDSAGVGEFKGDTSIGLPLNAVTDNEVIALGCGPVDSDCQGAALGNFHSYDKAFGAFHGGGGDFVLGSGE